MRRLQCEVVNTRFSVLVHVRSSDSRLDARGFNSRPWPQNTGMGDRLSAGEPPQYFTKPPRPTQPPTLSATGNEYQPKCGDALRLRVKGRYGPIIPCMDKRVGGR